MAQGSILGGLFLPTSLQILWCCGSPWLRRLIWDFLSFKSWTWQQLRHRTTTLVLVVVYLSELPVLKDCAQASGSLPSPFALGHILFCHGPFSSRRGNFGCPPVATWRQKPSRGWAGQVPGAGGCEGTGWPGSCPLAHFPIPAHTVHHLDGPSNGLIVVLHPRWCLPTSEHWRPQM